MSISASLYHDFNAAFRRNMLDGPHRSVATIIRDTICSSAPAWYLTRRRARRDISLVHSGIINSVRISPIRRARALALYARFIQAARDNPSTHQAAIIDEILSSPAPAFFITSRTAYNILKRRQLFIHK